jgi:ATP-binding cassette, subfamily B, bacterial PglK
MGELRVIYSILSNSRKRQFAWLIVLMLIGAVFEMASIGIIMPFLDIIGNVDKLNDYPSLVKILNLVGVIESGDYLLYVTIITIVVIIFSSLIRILLIIVNFKFVFSIGAEIGRYVTEKILNQTYEYHISSSSSDFISTIRKVDLVVDGVIKPLMQTVIAIVLFIAIAMFMLSISASITIIIGLTIFALYVLISFFSKNKLKNYSYIISYNEAKRVQALQEGLGGIRDIILDKTSDIFIDKFDKYNKELRLSQAGVGILSAFPRYVVELIGILGVVISSFYISHAHGETASYALIGVFIFATIKIIPNAQQIYYGWASIKGSIGVLQDLAGVIQLAKKGNSAKKYNASCFDEKSDIFISLKNISYKYPKSSFRILKNISLNIKRGSSIGIIGETGSGKSTLIDVIMGLIRISDGEIEVCGNILTNKNIDQWHDMITHVPQHVFLANSSIASNIAFGCRDINMKQVVQCAKIACLDQHVSKLNDGYKTFVGERGVKLSGGQIQRIGIARALYKNNPFMVLDEATSSLDGDTERKVINNITKEKSNITTVMIAHRLTTLKDCNQIIELKDGNIVWTGKYSELLQKNNQ